VQALGFQARRAFHEVRLFILCYAAWVGFHRSFSEIATTAVPILIHSGFPFCFDMKIAAESMKPVAKKKSASPHTHKSVEDIFNDFLRKKGYRVTPERALVLTEIYSSAEHFDADELFIRLKQKGGNISRATVYNTLELLVECNLVSQNSFGHKHLHYERSYGFEHHDHIICSDCGKVFEFINPEIEVQQDKVAAKLGFEIERHTLQIFAKCTRTNCENKPSDK
jgi:Fur family transcriptional regulator, ferric uptake regulator